MIKYSAIIIDDELKAIEGLEILIANMALPIHIAGTARNVIEGAKLFRQTNPDIVFLDIEMPSANGFDFLDLIDQNNKYFVFITAHEKYALKAIKNNINDYLLKPVSPDELKESIEKAIQYLQNSESAKVPVSYKMDIPTNKGSVYKDLNEIVYIKAENRYSEIICTDHSRYLVCKNLGEYENELREKQFFRVHKSFLINCNHVTGINNTDGKFVELTGGYQIEISQRKRGEFVKFMKS